MGKRFHLSIVDVTIIIVFAALVSIAYSSGSTGCPDWSVGIWFARAGMLVFIIALFKYEYDK